MLNKRAALVVTAAFIVIGPFASAQDLLLEWSDRPSNPNWLPGTAVFLRTLRCVQSGNQEYCDLSVISVNNSLCPINLYVDRFDTQSGNLRVLRTDKSVSLEFKDLSNDWSIHLDLGEKPGIVDRASGSVVTARHVPGAHNLTSDLIALVSDSKYARLVAVEMNCTKINAVAAKRSPAK